MFTSLTNALMFTLRSTTASNYISGQCVENAVQDAINTHLFLTLVHSFCKRICKKFALFSALIRHKIAAKGDIIGISLLYHLYTLTLCASFVCRCTIRSRFYVAAGEDPQPSISSYTKPALNAEDALYRGQKSQARSGNRDGRRCR